IRFGVRGFEGGGVVVVLASVDVEAQGHVEFLDPAERARDLVTGNVPLRVVLHGDGVVAGRRRSIVELGNAVGREAPRDLAAPVAADTPRPALRRVPERV